MIKAVLLTLAILMISGCGSQTPSVNDKQKVLVKNGFDENGRPLWLLNPDYDGHIGSVSILLKSNFKNKKKMLYIAQMQAKASFETRKGTTVDSSINTSISSDGKVASSEDLEISSTHVQTDKLVVKDTFEDKDSFYMWMVLEKN